MASRPSSNLAPFALPSTGSGLGQSRPITGVGHAARAVLFTRFLPQLLSVAASTSLVRDFAYRYRQAEIDEVLLAAQLCLATQVRGGELKCSPAVVENLLRTRLALHKWPTLAR